MFHPARIWALLAAVGLGVVVAGSAAAAAPATRPAVTAPPTQTSPAVVGPAHGVRALTKATATSRNWAGYAASGTTFTAVTARWTQPAVTCDPSVYPNLPTAVFWVGMDGWGSTMVEQGGSWARCIGDTPEYRVWWEMYPYNDVQVDFAITPGDRIRATVSYDTASQLFTILVADETSGQTLTKSIACQPGQGGCPRTSAEVISEDPTGGDVDGQAFLPNYGTATYTDVSVTNSAGHTGPLNDPAWHVDAVNQVSSQGVTKQTVGPLNATGTSFTTTWRAESGAGTPQLTNAYQVLNPATQSNQIGFAVKLVNPGTATGTLSNYTIRYWFTEDGTQPMAFSCDYAAIGCANVTGTFGTVSPAVPGADHYLEIGFRGGTVDGGTDTGPIQVRVYQSTYATMTQTNDYSFNAADTAYTPNPTITVYRNGTLIYGTQP